MWKMLSVHILFLITFLTSRVTGTINLNVERKLIKAGFHRDLVTTIHLPHSFLKDCGRSSLLVFETLSTGVYADPFHIESQERFGGPQVHFVQTVNIEAAEFVSKPLELYVYLDLSATSQLDVSKDDMMRAATITLPIHARYHHVSSDPDVTHASVVIPNPVLYTNCSKAGHSDSPTLEAPCNVRSSYLCTWHRLSHQNTKPQVVMTVPVGQIGHKLLVTVGTIFTSVLVSSVLVYVIVSHQTLSCDKSL